MSMAGIPSGGFKTIGQIVGTNKVFFRTDQSAEDAAVELLGAHMSGAPVVDADGKLVGFLSEFDILRVYEQRKDRDGHLDGLMVRDVMTKNPVSVLASTSLADALRIMKDNHWLNLPVVKDGVVEYSVTRHDLLRAYTGIGLGTEA